MVPARTIGLFRHAGFSTAVVGKALSSPDVDMNVDNLVDIPPSPRALRLVAFGPDA